MEDLSEKNIIAHKVAFYIGFSPSDDTIDEFSEMIS